MCNAVRSRNRIYLIHIYNRAGGREEHLAAELHRLTVVGVMCGRMCLLTRCIRLKAAISLAARKR